MQERFKGIKKRILDFLSKYTKKQKAIMASVISIVVVFLVIMIAVVGGDKYSTLVVCDDYTEVTEVEELLDENDITYKIEDDALTIQVLEGDLSEATILIGANSIAAEDYNYEDLEELLDGGYSQTSSDKEKLYLAYLQELMSSTLEDLDYVDTANVTITQSSASYSVLESDEEASVAVFLTLSSDVPDGAAESLATYVATAVGNETTDNISIIDNSGNIIFTGSDSDDDSAAVSASTQEEITENACESVIENIQKIFTDFDIVNVAPYLSINFDEVSTQNITYDTGDETQGPYTSSYNVDETGSSGTSGVAGTDSNDSDTTSYTITDSDGTESTYELSQYEYAVNQTVTTTDEAVGEIDYTDSSVSIVLNRYVTYDEETLTDDGTLDDLGMTWDEFKEANEDNVDITDDVIGDDVVEAVSFATGFETDYISIMAYEVPVFNDADESSFSIMDYLPIILAVAIVAMLGFVVWRSLKPVEVADVEPELSVEELLASTKEKTPVEEIDFDDKSDIRVAIENFVDEQPEAVALLLRNWLNEDWG